MSSEIPALPLGRGLRLTAGAKRRSPERQLHFAVAAFLRHAMPPDLPWTHVPAGEARDERTGAKLKMMGLRRGVPDLLFILPTGRAAFIELKSTKGALSPDQKTFRDQVMALGCAYAECRSVAQVETALRGWLERTGFELRATCAA